MLSIPISYRYCIDMISISHRSILVSEVKPSKITKPKVKGGLGVAKPKVRGGLGSVWSRFGVGWGRFRGDSGELPGGSGRFWGGSGRFREVPGRFRGVPGGSREVHFVETIFVTGL